MKKKLSIVVLLFLAVLGSAQIEYELGHSYSDIQASRKYYVNDSDKVCGLLIHRNKVTIQDFTANPLRHNSYETFENFPKYLDFVDIVKIKGKSLYFFSFHDYDGYQNLFCCEIDINNNRFVHEPKKIISVNDKLIQIDNHNISRVMNASSITPRKQITKLFQPCFSHDSSKILIVYYKNKKTNNEKKNRLVIGLNVFDSDLNKIWDKEVTMPYIEYNIKYYRFAVNNQGDVYMMLTVKDESLVSFHVNNRNRLELLKYSDHGNKYSRTPISIRDFYAYDFRLEDNCLGYLSCAGLYSKHPDKQNAKGCFFFNIDYNGKVINSNNFPFKLETYIKNEHNERKAKRIKINDLYNLYIPYLQLDDILIYNDGSIELISEVYEITVSHRNSTSYNSGNLHTKSSSYNYGNIIIMKISPEGNLVWEHVLKKNTRFGGYHWYQLSMSYKMLISGNTNYFIYFDYNTSLKTDCICLRYFHLDYGSGAVHEGKIFELKNKDLNTYIEKFSMDNILQINKNQFYMMVDKNEYIKSSFKVTLPTFEL